MLQKGDRAARQVRRGRKPFAARVGAAPGAQGEELQRQGTERVRALFNCNFFLHGIVGTVTVL